MGFGTAIGLHHTRFRRRPRSTLERSFHARSNGPDSPPISILKPLKGIDPGLLKNLESFFTQDYPEYELIFSVASPDDPALQLVRQLIEKYPEISTKIIITSRHSSVHTPTNPKVANLLTSYQQAQFNWILISDSNVRAQKTYLSDLASYFNTSKLGMITSIVSGQCGKGWGGRLEELTLNTFYARGMYLAFQFERPCVVGKAMLFRRSTMDRFGGIQTLARYLAEDYMAGEAVLQLGLEIVLTQKPVYQHIDHYGFKNFWSRQIRWGRLRKSQAPIVFWTEPFLYSVISGVLGAVGFSHFMSLSIEMFLLLHFGMIWIFDFILMKTQGVRVTHLHFLTWIFREIMALPLWIHIACGNTVEWRGQRLRLENGGLFAS